MGTSIWRPMEEDSELSSEQIQKEAEAINQKVNH